MNPVIAEIGQLALDGRHIDTDRAAWLAALDGDDLYDLFYWANAVRVKAFGRSVTFCSIAAGKIGGCAEDCRFCAQSARYHTHVGQPSRTSIDAIVDAARQAAAAGAGSFGVVNSGRSPQPRDLDDLAVVARKLAGMPVMLCASLGCLDAAAAGRLAEIGVRRYNHNLETSRRFYPNIVSTHSYEDRITTLRNVREAGIQLCSGGIFNLGETWQDRIDMAIALRELNVDMVPLNFLSPISGTPLADRPAMPPMEILKVVAIYRLMLPRTPIKLAGGREANLRDLQSWMFYCGATSCMAGNYLTTCGRPADMDRQLVADLGLALQAEA